MKHSMSQVWKFYLSSFLKNQTYFVPILIVFLQAQHLTLSQIFWVFALGSAASFILEIPSGVMADFFGKKPTILLAKSLGVAAFLMFAFSDTFWLFVAAQVVYEVSKAFKSGSEAAYIYDYLDQDRQAPDYTEVKAKQKFWARGGEAIATALGGVIAAQLSYRAVFLIAAVPALANVVNVATWNKIPETRVKKDLWAATKRHLDTSWKRVRDNTRLRTIIINFSLFTAALAAIATFIQPYMKTVGIPIEQFGFIYSGALVISAFLARYAKPLGKKYGMVRSINALAIIAIVPALILGLGLQSLIGVILLFTITVVENVRNPLANTYFHQHVKQRERATIGSFLQQMKSLGKMILLPIAGALAETTMPGAILLATGILAINSLMFHIRSPTPAKHA
ncbi:MAG: MFS transporter [Candidatus Woesearchaeota archaeon]